MLQFLQEMTVTKESITIIRVVCATANLVGRFASGLFLVMPVLIAKCAANQGAGAANAGPTCFDTVKKYVTVRILYCGASCFFVLSVLLVALVGFSGGARWTGALMAIYILLGLSGGCLFS